MLGKLIKYEIRWTARFLLPLYIILAFITVAGRIILANVNYESEVVSAFLGILIMGYIFSIISISCGTFVIVMVRFYKNMMTDEGYLMFTLPAKVSTHILAKGMVASVWTLINIILTFVSVYLLMSGNPEMSASFKYEMNNMYMELHQVFGNDLTIIVIEFIICFIISSVLSVLYIYVSIAIGQLISKNKILGSIAAYIVINMVLQFVIVIGMVIIGIFNIENMSNDDGVTMFKRVLPFINIISVALSIAFFYITNHILNRKLNLE